jgi:trypsin
LKTNKEVIGMSPKQKAARTVIVGLVILCLTTALWALSFAQLAGDKKITSRKDLLRDFPDQGSLPFLNALSEVQGKGLVADDTVKITNGEDAQIEDIYWQVSIRNSDPLYSNLGGHFCGGTVIKSNWILTAAHCVENRTLPSMIQVIQGLDDLTLGAGARISVTKIVMHEKYDPETKDNDIALLRLSNPITSRPISLITPKEEVDALPPTTRVLISGWGHTKEDGKKSPKLQKAIVEIIDRTVCNSPDSYKGTITDNMLCAASEDKPGKIKDSCQGDSGGPMVLRHPDKGPILVGVVSFGYGCARAKYYGVYTRVSKYIDWITVHAI